MAAQRIILAAFWPRLSLFQVFFLGLRFAALCGLLVVVAGRRAGREAGDDGVRKIAFAVPPEPDTPRLAGCSIISFTS